MLYTWMRVANIMWPRTDFRSSLAKAFTEQAAYDPFAIVFFFYGMSILERKSQHQAAEEVGCGFYSGKLISLSNVFTLILGPVQILGHLQGWLLLLAMRANVQLFNGASQEPDCGSRIFQPDLDDLFGLRENHGQGGGTSPDGASRGTSPPGMERLQAVGFKIVKRIDFMQS